MQRLDTQPLWISGEDGYFRYRIPALTVTAAGTVLAFCEARKYTGGDSDQIDLLVRRSSDHGRSFAPPQLVATEPDWVCGNPAPVVDRDTGSIWLPFCKNRRDGDERMICHGQAPRTVWVTASHDDGATWEEPVEITAQVKQPDWTWYATGPGHGIQLASGRLLIPCDHIVARHYEAHDPYHSHVIYSDDHGATWTIGGSADEGTNESIAVQTEDGWLCLNCRNKSILRHAEGGQHRAVAWSNDGGRTFSPIVRDVALPEPICQASMCRYPRRRRTPADPVQQPRGDHPALHDRTPQLRRVPQLAAGAGAERGRGGLLRSVRDGRRDDLLPVRERFRQRPLRSPDPGTLQPGVAHPRRGCRRQQRFVSPARR